MTHKIIALQDIYTLSQHITKVMVNELPAPTLPYSYEGMQTFKLTNSDYSFQVNHYFEDNTDDKIFSVRVCRIVNGKKVDSEELVKIKVCEDVIRRKCHIMSVVTQQNWRNKGVFSFLYKGLLNHYENGWTYPKFYLVDMSSVDLNNTADPYWGPYIYIKQAIRAGYRIQITVKGKDQSSLCSPAYKIWKSKQPNPAQSVGVMLGDIDNRIQHTMLSEGVEKVFTIFSNNINDFDQNGFLRCYTQKKQHVLPKNR